MRSAPGQLGIVKLLGEASIGAGVRRVEALVGTDAYSFLAREHVLLSQVTDALKVRSEELPDRIASLVARLREAEKDLERLRGEKVLAVAGDLAANPTDVFGVAFVGHHAPDGTTADDLRKLVLDVRGRFPADRPCGRRSLGQGGRASGRHRRGQRSRPRVGRQGR